MTLREKIQSIVDKNGIKTFGCTRHDLKIFTLEELLTLCNKGLISNEDYTYMILQAGN